MGAPLGHMERLPEASVDVPFPQIKGLLLFLWCPQTSWDWPTAGRLSFWSQRTQRSLFPHPVSECEDPSGLGAFGFQAGLLRPQCSFRGSGLSGDGGEDVGWTAVIRRLHWRLEHLLLR